MVNHIKESLPAPVQRGTVTVGATAVQVEPKGFVFSKFIRIRAHDDNSVPIYIGTNSGVTAAAGGGFPLAATQSIDLPIEQATSLYAIASAAAQQLDWIGV